ncbi:MAG: hypothetical protein HZA93_13180 [Verrucomicrobia bacterium]|nr:hypothetical protein [Verrucomicrobiota bacterium]
MQDKLDTSPGFFGLRLRAHVEGKGTIEQAYQDIGVSRATLFNWFDRKTPPPGEEKLEKLRRYLGKHAAWILDGIQNREAPISHVVVETTPVRYVPLVSWAHAGAAVSYEEIPRDERERVATMCTDPRALAVTIEGESMLPDFKPGDRLIVAPSRDPRNGHPVVAKLSDDGIVVRLYHRLNARTVRLSSLRPEIYPSIDYAATDLQWCWPVEELNRKV